ncbi:MAG: DEAD/DEAH box helicase [Actinomycetota bacterium]
MTTSPTDLAGADGSSGAVTPDRFQLDAFAAIDDGRHVVVAAPTGSGKTLVAEHGIDRMLDSGRRSFYTTPVKALSNQKYRDLCRIHGSARVGLLTGDNSINADADVVVMTTEVLRNMLYTGRPLDDLGLVVLDEVHFLQDTYRGPVWEEVIVHLPDSVQLVCLSATVSNVRDLTDWMTDIRGTTDAVVESTRPVPLESRYFVADRTEHRLHLMPVFVGGGPNRKAISLDESAIRRPRAGGRGGDRGDHRRSRRGNPRSSKSTTGTRRLAPPGGVETVERLDDEGLLPSIYFIFSRAQCDEAAQAIVDAGIHLIGPAEATEIDRLVAERLHELDDDDREALEVDRFVRRLHHGVAAHHAGMVPAMKETVEACFAAGLLRVVFATETLAVGINMPARSVVIEKLTKYTGDGHERLTPGEYTQLTGRAGRRGIDEVGDAVVLWSPWVRFDEVAQLASSSSFHLRSAFRPTYNMVANLVRRHGRDDAERLVSLSFAQFQADRDVVRLEARLDRLRGERKTKRHEARSPYGDIDEYRSIRSEERRERDRNRQASAGEMRGALARLKPGTVIGLRTRHHRGPVVVVATAHRRSGVHLTVVNKSGDTMRVTGDDFDEPPVAIGRVDLPRNFGPHRNDHRTQVAKRLRSARLDRQSSDQNRDTGASRRGHRSADELDVARDPDLRSRLDAASRADRLDREIADIGRRVASKQGSLRRQFDAVLDLLDDLGHLDVEAWSLNEGGRLLTGVFHECDLLVVEALQDGLLDGLGPADLAAIVSCVVYEHRSPEPPAPPWFSSKDVRRRWTRLEAISEDLRARERSVELTEHRAPDPTFAAIAHAWVAGEGFSEIVESEDLTGGDFVRTMRQLIDLLRQLSGVADDPGVRTAAAEAAQSAFRGVVADSGTVGITDEPSGDDS